MRRRSKNPKKFETGSLPASMGLSASEQAALRSRTRTLRVLLQEANGELTRLVAAQHGSRREFFAALRSWGDARDRMLAELSKPLGVDEKRSTP